MPNIEIMIAVLGNTPPDLSPRIFPIDQIQVAKDGEMASLRVSGVAPSGIATYEAYNVVRDRLETLSSDHPVALVSDEDLAAAQAAYGAAHG
jgi:hypothetical protein